jgi:hypothetical protein
MQFSNSRSSTAPENGFYASRQGAIFSFCFVLFWFFSCSFLVVFDWFSFGFSSYFL